MAKKVIIPNLRAPKGFHFKIFKYYNSIKIQLLDAKTGYEVGNVGLYKAYPYRYKQSLETHSHLRVDLRGKGLGTLMYSKAIEWALKNGYRVKSSGSSSEMAERVWNGKGIRKHFNIRRIDRKSKGYFSDLWYAYAKPASKRAKRKGRR